MTEDAEIKAMAAAAAALQPLDESTQRRVVEWLRQRFGGPTFVAPAAAAPPVISPSGVRNEFENFADLFDAAQPTTEKEKTLVAAYWTQVCQAQPNFPAQTLNALLKDLGHGVGNITDSLDSLKAERPAMILQLKKSGTSKQARKIYKLTEEGARRVRASVSGGDQNDIAR